MEEREIDQIQENVESSYPLVYSEAVDQFVCFKVPIEDLPRIFVYNYGVMMSNFKTVEQSSHKISDLEIGDSNQISDSEVSDQISDSEVEDDVIN